MSGPSEVTSAGTLDFATSGQAMFGSGSSDFSATLAGGSASGSFNVDGLNGAIAISAGLVASLDNAVGAIAADYPINMTVGMPNMVAPGQQFTVDTIDDGLAPSSATLTPTFPTAATASLGLALGGSISAGFHTNIPVLDLLNTSFATGNISTDPNLTVPLVSNLASSASVSLNFPDNAGSLSVSLPNAYASVSNAADGTGVLPSLTVDAQTSDFLTADTNLIQDAADLAAPGFSKVWPTLAISTGKSGASLNFELDWVQLEAAAGLDFAQQFTFDPTGVTVAVTADWSDNKTTTDIVNLGQSATFTVPTDQVGSVSLSTTYTLNGNLVDQFGVEGNFSLDYTEASGSISASINEGPIQATLFTQNFGPVINEPVPLPFSNTAPAYLKTFKSALGGFNSISSSYTIGLGSGVVFGPGSGGPDTVAIGGISAFSANAASVVQAALDTSDGADNGTNIYIPPGPSPSSGSATAVSGDLNVEIFEPANGTAITETLAAGFAVGLLEANGKSDTLVGNATDVVLAAAPGPGVTDTLKSVDQTDTLVGGASGLVNFLVTSGFTGEITGLQLADTIDVTDLRFNSGTASLGANNLLTLSEGGVGYDIRLDPGQNFGNLGFTIAADGSSGTDITLGTVVSAGKNMTVANGQIVNGIDVFKNGSAVVDQGGIAIGAVVSGKLFVGSVPSVNPPVPDGRATASSTVIYNGGVMSVTTGLAVDTVISKGGKETVIGFGTVDVGAAVSTGAVLDVLFGGMASGTLVYAGGVLSAQGAGGSSTTISGATTFSSGASTLDGAMVESGGKAVVSAGGAASGTVVLSRGTLTVAAGGTAIGTIVSKGGIEKILPGTFVEKNGVESILAGGIASGTLVYSGGSVAVSSGGSAVATQIAKGGTETISAGGSSGPLLNSLSGIDLSSLTTSDGGILNVYGRANYTDVLNGGILTIHAGGVASSTNVEFGGQEIISSGGTDLEATNAGRLTILKGATFEGGDTGQADLYGTAPGSIPLLSGVVTYNSLTAGQGGVGIGNGGILTVHPGGIANGSLIGSGGVEFVSSGGTVNGVVLAGTSVVGSGGTALLGGELVLQAGATLEGTIDFLNDQGGGSTLEIGGTNMPTDIISGFSGVNGPDTIDLANVAFHSGGTVAFGSTNSGPPATTLTITEGATTAQLLFDPSLYYLDDDFNPTPVYGQTLELQSDGHGGTELTDLATASPITPSTGATVYMAPDSEVLGGAHNLIVPTLNETLAYTIEGGNNDTIDVSNVGYQDQVGGAVIEDMPSPVGGPVTSPIHDTVIGFTENADQLYFNGEGNYNSPAQQQVIATAKLVNGSSVLTYPDHSTITLMGVTHVDVGVFAFTVT